MKQSNSSSAVVWIDYVNHFVVWHFFLQGTPDKLTLQLIENNATDPSYIEDFLLTYRTFLKSPLDVTRKLYSWLQDPVTREKVGSSLCRVDYKEIIKQMEE